MKVMVIKKKKKKSTDLPKAGNGPRYQLVKRELIGCSLQVNFHQTFVSLEAPFR